VGHLQLLHKDFRTFIPALGDRLVCLHLHDNDAVHDQHVAPLSGTIRWKQVCDALKEIDYAYDLSFETFMQTRKALWFDESLVLPWLTVMAKTADAFRKHIQQ
jgi:sugar phosphate isomerase/epimerase